MLIDELKSLIKQKSVSIAKLARLADLHQDTIYKYLNNKSSISVRNYEKLRNVLDNLKG